MLTVKIFPSLAPSPEPRGSGDVDMFDMSHSPQWCRLVVQALYVYEPTQTREL